MVYITVHIPYAPLSMNVLDVYLFFTNQTGNSVISVKETIKRTRNGKHKMFTIKANPSLYRSIFNSMDDNYRIVRYIWHYNKYSKIRAWIYEN
jgi:ribosomal protein L30E